MNIRNFFLGTGRMKKMHWLLFLSVPIILFAQLSMVSAQETGNSGGAVPWDTLCRTETRLDNPECEMSQVVLVKDTGRVLMRISIRVPPQEGNPVMMIQLPHSIYLPAGLHLKIDSQDWLETNVQTCNKQGCYAATVLSKDSLQKLMKGNELFIGYQSLERNEVVVPVDLNGFTASYGKIK